ncbi:uncharacterized protein TOT_010001225 [Theileria orientalis strain Shintoku]|uniref:S1 motif domain-containing protein n=1 Tax=Theileria orientalis strain Shintoku TaxID=869250 RepID=J7MC24_THEOR|nr:uncharacterized protein TOT_010001225 [Theileria orientalis strain Shintoku]BAM38752.1 uncharacterized protein TOT_010001225 [Theileria orientalis strain Shintoku]|eukprot:XP_009689053.1 uncharacterized protein TOT_010001225 [Theileria orientalis strain Shintoku]
MSKEEDFPRSNLNGRVLTLDSKGKPSLNKVNKPKSHSSLSPEINGLTTPSNYPEDYKLPSLESLNPGSLVLGSVALVTPFGLRIHIFNNIVGFAKYSELFDLVESKSGGSEDNLASPFSVGSNVVCYVLEVYHSSVALSLKPSLVNKNLRPNNLFAGLLLPATVLSQEDHGFTLSFNVNLKSAISGFVMYDEKSREGVKNEFIKRYPPSSTAHVIVNSMNPERGLVKCVWPWEYKTPMDLHTATVFDVLKPGLLLTAEVSEVHRLKCENSYKQPLSGYTVKCLGSLTAFVSPLHSLESYKPADSAEGSLGNLDDCKEVNDRAEARLIYVDFEARKLYVSLQWQLLKWRGPLGLAHKNLKHTVMSCKVVRSLSSGLVLEHEEEKEPSTLFFCSIKDVVDDKSLKPATILTSSTYSVGTVHDCRVLDFNYLTRLTHVALKESVIKEKYASAFEFSASELVRGKTVKLVNSGAIVQLSSLVYGKVPVGHLTDVPPTKVPENFQTGRNMRLRVLRFDHARNRLVLTAKPSLVNDTDPAARFDHLHVGKKLTGYIINMKEKNYMDEKQNERIVIKFYGDLQTYMDRHEVERAEELGVDLKTDSVVKCAVTRMDSKKHTFSVTVDRSYIEKLELSLESKRQLNRNKRKMACKEAFKGHKHKKKNNAQKE